MTSKDLQDVLKRFKLDIATVTKHDIQTLAHCEKQNSGQVAGSTVSFSQSRQSDDEETGSVAKKQKKATGLNGLPAELLERIAKCLLELGVTTNEIKKTLDLKKNIRHQFGDLIFQWCGLRVVWDCSVPYGSYMAERAFKDRSIITLLQKGRSPHQDIIGTRMASISSVTRGLVDLNAWSLSELAWTAFRYPLCMQQYYSLGCNQRRKDITAVIVIEDDHREFHGEDGAKNKKRMTEFLTELMRLGYLGRKAKELLAKLERRSICLAEDMIDEPIVADDVRPFRMTIAEFSDYDDDQMAEFTDQLQWCCFEDREDA